MRILYGQELVNELRGLSDKVTERLWIAVPYIGDPDSVKRILGINCNNPAINVRLLTDISDLSCINIETLKKFNETGKVKTLLGLHAKIYIIDDTCLITSANLTNTAFTKRHEIGILCESNEAKQIIDIFNEWWDKSDSVQPEQLIKTSTTITHSKEETGTSFPVMFKLSESPYDVIERTSTQPFNSNKSEPNEAVSAFWNDYYRYICEDMPELNMLMKKDDRQTRSFFIHFKPFNLPKHTRFIHKIITGNIDIQFHKLTFLEVTETYEHLLINGMKIIEPHDGVKSTSIRLETQKMNTHNSFSSQLELMQEAAKKISVMNEWMKQNMSK